MQNENNVNPEENTNDSPETENKSSEEVDESLNKKSEEVIGGSLPPGDSPSEIKKEDDALKKEVTDKPKSPYLA